MELIVFEKEAYYKMLNEVKSMVRASIKEVHDEAEKKRTEPDWIDVNEAKKLLGLKSKTVLQRLRSEGLIVYTKCGKLIQYSRKSIMEYLESNKISFK
jgi:hypothetical protein